MRTRMVRASLALVVIVALGWMASTRHSLHDLTAEKTLTLTPQTRSIIDRVDDDVDITVFVRPDDPTRVPAASLLDRYRKLNRHIDWEVRDPDTSPGEVERLGVDPFLGGVAAQSGDDVVVVPSATEPDITAALARLFSGRETVVCLTTGHGEDQLDQARSMLNQEGYLVDDVDLLTGGDVDEDCTVVVVAGPAERLGEGERALAEWLDDDGKLLLLADPVADADFSAVLGPYGLELVRGLVFEGDADSVIGGDITAPVVRVYSSANPIVRNLAPTYFPGVQAIEVDDSFEERSPGLTNSRLADSSGTSYLETEPVEAEFDPEVDAPGPLTVAASADHSRVDGDEIIRNRVVVVGDVDFATDRFLGEAANATFLLRAVAWLAEGDDVAAISPNLPSDRPLRLTDGRITYARLLTVGVIPALFLVAGGLVWAVRRQR